MTVFNESVTCGRPRRFHAAHCMSYDLGDEKSLHCTEGSPLLSFERARSSAMACTAIFFYLTHCFDRNDRERGFRTYRPTGFLPSPVNCAREKIKTGWTSTELRSSAEKCTI